MNIKSSLPKPAVLLKLVEWKVFLHSSYETQSLTARGQGRRVPITRSHTNMSTTKGGESQLHSGTCIGQGGNRAEKQKVIEESCSSEVIWMKLLNSYQDRFLFLIHHLEHLILKTSQTRNQVKGEMAFGRDITARGPWKKKKTEPKTPLTLLLSTSHILCSMVLIVDVNFPGGWLPYFSTWLIIPWYKLG